MVMPSLVIVSGASVFGLETIIDELDTNTIDILALNMITSLHNTLIDYITCTLTLSSADNGYQPWIWHAIH